MFTLQELTGKENGIVYYQDGPHKGEVVFVRWAGEEGLPCYGPVPWPNQVLWQTMGEDVSVISEERSVLLKEVLKDTEWADTTDSDGCYVTVYNLLCCGVVRVSVIAPENWT